MLLFLINFNRYLNKDYKSYLADKDIYQRETLLLVYFLVNILIIRVIVITEKVFYKHIKI